MINDLGTRLWLPPPALAGCLRGAMLRDTRGQALSAQQRESYFPAVPLVKLVWRFAGSGQWLQRPGFSAHQAGYHAGTCTLIGPSTAPTHTRDAGPVQLLMLLFPPDAF